MNTWATAGGLLGGIGLFLLGIVLIWPIADRMARFS